MQLFLTELAIKRPFKFPPHPICAFALPEDYEHVKQALKRTKKNVKNIPNIIDLTWRRMTRYNSFWYNHSCHKWPSNDRSSSHLTQRLFLHYLQRQNKRKVHWNEQKTSKISSLWICGPHATALTSVCSLTMFAVSYSSESIGRCLGMLMKSRSDWLKSAAEHYRHCYQWMEKASASQCFRIGPIYQILIVSSWTTGQLGKLSAKVAEIWTKCDSSCVLF